MGFKLKANNGGGGERPPVGNHMAVCVAVIDMGHQEHSYQGQPPTWKRNVYLLWELVGEKIAGTKDKNHVIGAALTLSFHEKAQLRKWVEARTGQKISNGTEYDISAELGQACLLNVVNNEKGYPRIEGVAALPKGLPIPPATYPLTLLTIEDIIVEGKDPPEWVPYHMGSPLIDHIKASREMGGAKPTPKAKAEGQPAGAGQDGGGDKIPF